MRDLDLAGFVANEADATAGAQEYHGSISPAHDALNRMKAAYEAGRGVRLSWVELEALNRTLIGSIWDQPDPRESDGSPD